MTTGLRNWRLGTVVLAVVLADTPQHSGAEGRRMEDHNF